MVVFEDRRPAVVTFDEAWERVMRCEAARVWAFDSRAPTAEELVRSSRNTPFMKSFFIDVPNNDRNSPLQGTVYKQRMDELYCAVRVLRDGTRLGVLLNTAGCDITAPLFAAFDKRFADPRLAVNRLVATTVRGVIFSIEFAWMLSGALTVRFHAFASLGRQPKANFSVRAFSPEDASFLSAMAICGQPSDDFLRARFPSLLMVSPHYCLESSDTAFQLSCVFCAARGALQCDCPMPMRRRSSAQERICGRAVEGGKKMWLDVTGAKKMLAKRGAAVFNVSMVTKTAQSAVLFSGFVPFDFECTYNAQGHHVFHRSLSATGTTLVEPSKLLVTEGNLLSKRSRSRNRWSEFVPTELAATDTPLISAFHAAEHQPGGTAAWSTYALDNLASGHNTSSSSGQLLSLEDDLDATARAPSGGRGEGERFSVEALTTSGGGGAWNSGGSRKALTTSDDTLEVDEFGVPLSSANLEFVTTLVSTDDSSNDIVGLSSKHGSSSGTSVKKATESTAAVAAALSAAQDMQRVASDAAQAVKKLEMMASTTIQQVQLAANAAIANATGNAGGSGSGSGSGSGAGSLDGTPSPGEAANKRVYVCPICGQTILNKKSNLKRHIENKHGNERRFACPEPGCGLKFHTSNNLRRHVTNVHRRRDEEQQQGRVTCTPVPPSHGEQAPTPPNVAASPGAESPLRTSSASPVPADAAS